MNYRGIGELLTVNTNENFSLNLKKCTYQDLVSIFQCLKAFSYLWDIDYRVKPVKSCYRTQVYKRRHLNIRPSEECFYFGVHVVGRVYEFQEDGSFKCIRNKK